MARLPVTVVKAAWVYALSTMMATLLLIAAAWTTAWASGTYDRIVLHVDPFGEWRLEAFMLAMGLFTGGGFFWWSLRRVAEWDP